jgi:hypothetical protein
MIALFFLLIIRKIYFNKEIPIYSTNYNYNHDNYSEMIYNLKITELNAKIGDEIELFTKIRNLSSYNKIHKKYSLWFSKLEDYTFNYGNALLIKCKPEFNFLVKYMDIDTQSIYYKYYNFLNKIMLKNPENGFELLKVGLKNKKILNYLNTGSNVNYGNNIIINNMNDTENKYDLLNEECDKQILYSSRRLEILQGILQKLNINY